MTTQNNPPKRMSDEEWKEIEDELDRELAEELAEEEANGPDEITVAFRAVMGRRDNARTR